MKAIFYNGRIEDNFLGHQMSEIYKDRVYAPLLEGRKDLTILDIGANIGVTANYFSQFAKKVYSVEPSLEHFTVLLKTIEYNKLDNVTPINKAVYMKTGNLPFYHNPNKTMYSLHQAVHDPNNPPEKVDCITIEDLIKDNKIKKIDFMKLDIEGSEGEVLGHSSFSRIADKIQTMVVELHAWNGLHPNQIAEYLRLRGFEVKQIPNDANLILATRK